jgi:transposase
MALLLARENQRLRIALQEKHGTDPGNLELELQYLQEQLAARTRALYGPSSEKRSTPESSRPAKPKKGHGPRAQPALPVVEQVHELDVADRVCTECGDALEEWSGQFEESEEIDVVARSYRIVRRRCQKYRCKRGHSIETAPGPPKLISGGRYSVDFGVDVAVSKYLDHMPLARQVKQMRRQDLQVDSQTLWDQLVALERHLEPSYAALLDYVQSARVVGADETTWRMMGKRKDTAKRFWVWSITREDAVAYRILPSRSADAAREVLGEFEGVVMCDGYAAYSALEKAQANARDGPRFALAHCWAHVRRSRLAYTAQLRRERSESIVEALWDWMREQRALPRSALGKAIAYAAGLWGGLTRFLDDPEIPLDNNASERGLRSVVVGRKNHYGSRSLHGTRVAALFYSLLESAKLAGVDPAAYLAEATRRAIASPGTVTLPRDLR